MQPARIRDLKRKILAILEEDEQSRNSDIRLTQCIWYRYFPEFMVNINGEYHVAIKHLFDLPREDNIKRVRAKIQNEENKFLPTSPEVRKQRKINEDKWRAYMGYDNPARG